MSRYVIHVLLAAIAWLVFNPSALAQDDVEMDARPRLVIGNFYPFDFYWLPNTHCHLLGQLTNRDHDIFVTGVSADEQYYRVEFEGQEGWIRRARNPNIEGDLTQVPVVEPASILGEVQVPTLYTDTIFADILVSPYHFAPVLVNDASCMALPITGISAEGRYYQVEIDGRTGWVSGLGVSETAGEMDRVPVIETACIVQATQARSASVRVGPGTNRAAMLFLPPDEPFTVIGIAGADDGSLWWRLDKQEVAPDSAAAELWVAQAQVSASGGCGLVVFVDTPPVIPLSNASP